MARGGSPVPADTDPIRSSLNAPVPGRVAAVAGRLRSALTPFESVRDRHTLVVKRLGEVDPAGRQKRVRQALSGTPVIEARVTEIGTFTQPAAGPAPVVYLAVESPGLVQLHRQLCAAFGAVPAIEGDAYVPHITLARGGGAGVADAVERLVATEIDPVAWTVTELVFWDARYDEVTGRVSLPA